MDRTAEARWTGDLKAGKGSFKVGSGALALPYSFASRFEGSADTNPEELLGAAHSACYSMALSAALAKGGHTPTSVTTTATVHLNKTDAGFAITGIDLVTRGVVPGVSEAEFMRLASETRTGCIVSRALAAVPMTLDAKLLGT
ncbi:MAG: OsmC family peroxiredoxin [Gemmatimonadales bacterium]